MSALCEAATKTVPETELNIEANGIQLEGNLPIEDRLIARHMENVKGFFMGVYDGHGGWQVAELC